MVFHEQDSLPMNFPKKMHIEISPKTESHAKQLKVMLCPLLHENYLIWGNNTQALEGHGPDGAIHVEHEAHLLDSVLIQRQRERKLCPIFAEFFAFLPGMATVRTYTLFLRANTSGGTDAPSRGRTAATTAPRSCPSPAPCRATNQRTSLQG